MTAMQSSTIPLSVERLKRFLKEKEVPVLAFWIPKVHWKKVLWKKFRRLFEKFDNSLRNFYRLFHSLSNLVLVAQAF